MEFIKKIKIPLLIRQRIYSFGLLGMFILNIFFLCKEINRIHNLKKDARIQVVGFKFKGLENVIKNVQRIGFYTDRDINDTENAKLYSQIQFLIAPVIVDYNDLDHEFVLFVCSNEQIAWKKIIELKAKPILRNKFGIILARRNL